MRMTSARRFALGVGVGIAALCAASVPDATASLVQGVRRIEIDILPNRKENEIRLADSNKSLQVVVLGEANFNVAQIDRSTVQMAGAMPVSMNGRRVDTNLDRHADIEYRFEIGKLALTDTTTSLCVTGKLRDGDMFRGCGDVVIKP